MRIGEFTDTFLPIVDGVGRVVHAYATELSKLEHEVTVVTPLYDTGHRGGYPFEIVDYIGYPVPTTPQYRTGSPATDAHYRKRIRMVQMDILHAHGPFGAGREALRLAKSRKIPLIASFHSKYYDDFLKVTKSETLAKIALSNVVSYYEKCDDVWAVSEATAEVLRSYGYKGPLHVMPNGVTLREPTARGRETLAQQYPRLGTVPMLLFVGQMNWKKNILRVLEASHELLVQGIPFHLVLAGQGPDEAAIRSKVEEFGLQAHCTMTGHIGDAELLDALYEKASLFLFPSLYDNAPMVVRESAVMGTPAVLIRGSDAAEIVHHKENGLLCEDSGADLARVVRDALSTPADLARLGEAARRTIPTPWSRIMLQVVEGYERNIKEFKGR